VRLRALLDNRADELKANAERLVYFANTRALELSGNVLLRQGGDQFSAQHLRYTLDDQRLIAHGSDAEDGRVHALIQPPPAKNSP
jgi:lipopolysaccharide transport protein LptA